jgi:hypothetical protein
VMIGMEAGAAPVALQLVTEKSDWDLLQSCNELRIGRWSRRVFPNAICHCLAHGSLIDP